MRTKLLLFIFIVYIICTNASITLCNSNNNYNINELKRNDLSKFVAKRVANEPTSPWVELGKLKLEFKKQKANLLDFGQGFANYDVAPEFLTLTMRNISFTIDNGKQLNNQYTRSYGHPALTKALLRYYRSTQFSTSKHLLANFNNENDQVLVTIGAYEALYTAIMAFVDINDEVIIIEPSFDAYAPMVALAGGKVVTVSLKRFNRNDTNSSSNAETLKQPLSNSKSNSCSLEANCLSSRDFALDLQDLKAKINKRTKMLIVNTPSNPLGKVFSTDELSAISELAIKNDFLILADEVYDRIVFDNAQHKSIATFPQMWQRVITVGSAGKTFSVTGWKIGWAVGASELIKAMQLIHQNVVFLAPTLLQEALAQTFEYELNKQSSNQSYWHLLKTDLLRKRNKLALILSRANISFVEPEGSYFMLADLSPLLTTKSNDTSVISTNNNQLPYLKFARSLIESSNLVAIPESVFYSSSVSSLQASNTSFRLCFIKSDETFDKLEQLLLSTKQ